MNKIVCIIQARTGSSRLPNKIFLDLQGKTVLGRVIERTRNSKLINEIVIATPDSKPNDVIQNYIKDNYPAIKIFRGSENNVLERYYLAAKENQADIIVRITSDCPLIDSQVIDQVIKNLIDNQVDYAANVLGQRTYPRGMDVEVFTFSTLEKIYHFATEAEDKEHVTLYLLKNPNQFKTLNVTNNFDYSKFRLTIDEQKDFELVNKIFSSLKDDCSLEDIIKLFKENPELELINAEVKQKYAEY